MQIDHTLESLTTAVAGRYSEDTQPVSIFLLLDNIATVVISAYVHAHLFPGLKGSQDNRLNISVPLAMSLTGFVT